MRNLKAWDSSRKCINEIRGYVDNDETIRIFYKSGGFVSYPKGKIVILEGIGIKDKNSVEIHRGDIVDCDMSFNGGVLPHRGEIVYLDKIGAFATKNDGGETLLHNHILSSFEIIGNIYENQELLK